MMLKKTICIFLVVTIVCSLSVTSIFAQQTLCQKVGINELSASNTQVINLGDSIGVFSSPISSDLSVDGYSLLALLVGSTAYPITSSQAVTSEGYALEYITPSGICDPAQIVEHGGYIRAMKDDETVNIPIVDIYHLKSYDESQIGKDWQNIPSGTSISRQAAGLAGKNSDDKSLQFTVNPETTVTSANPARLDSRGIDTLNTPKTVITIEFEIRVTGDAVAVVERNDGYSLLKLKSDGTMSFKSYDAGNVMVDIPVCSDASLWHSIALTYDYAGNRILYYFDGEMLETTGARTSDGILSEFRFALDNKYYQSGGTFAVDNVCITRGYYKPFGLVGLTSSDERIQASSSQVVVFSDPANPEYFISSAKLLDALSADDEYSIEYVDNSKKAVSADSVQSGYIRISNLLGKHHYIPISARGAFYASEFGKDCVLHNENGSNVSDNFFDVGGKSDDDSVFSFSVGNSELSGIDYLEYTADNTNIPYTYVFNVYADGDAIAQLDLLNNQKQTTMLKWGADGSLQYSQDSVVSDEKHLRRGMWHQLCVVYNSCTSYFSLYADGDLITDKLISADSGSEHKLLFAISPDSVNGTVAFDDLNAYAGFYYSPESVVTTIEGADVFLDCDREIAYYDCSAITDAHLLIEAIQESTDASEVRIYDDYTFSSKASSLGKDSVVVVSASELKRYLYLKPSPEYVKLVSKRGKVNASYYAPQGNRTLILALYDNTTLSDIVIKQITNSGSYNAELKYDMMHTYKAFVRENDLVTPISCFEGCTDNFHVSNRVVLNCDFETAFPLTSWKNGSVIEQCKEDDGNTAVLFERKDVGDFHLNASGFNHQSDTMVIEFDLKVLEPLTAVNFMLQDEKGNTYLYGQVLSGGILKFGNENIQLDMDKWYTFSVIINLYDRTITTFVNDEEKSTRALGTAFAVDSGVNHLRYHVPPTTVLASSPVKFLTDNLKIYEGIELIDELGDIKNEIILDGKTVFPSESPLRDLMKGYFSIHTRSGVTYANGVKTVPDSKPYQKDGIAYVNAPELADALGLTTDFEGDVSIGDFAASCGLVCTRVTNPLNDGLYILGNNSFAIPEDDGEVDKLNDFLFYQRPSPEEVLELYEKSPTKNQHPRIQATAGDFERIREQIKTDEYMKLWSGRLIREADALFDKEPVIYELRDGQRLLYVSRDVMNNMYALGMAYQLTGDKKYADRAWLDLKAVCVDFFDWHPGHDIDCAEMAAAVAIGYDWMYDAFTEEQRLAIEDGIYQKGLYQAALGFQSTNAPMGSIAIWGQNRTIVCCSGVSMAALAVMDVYPKEAAFIVSCGARAVESVIDMFGPDGAYFEGPSYWEYTMQYVAKHLSSLTTALGTNLRFDCVEGLSVTTDYELHMQTSNGTYIFGDGSSAKTYVPEMLWLAGLYDNKGNAEVVMKLTNGNFTGAEDLALALLWYDVNTNTDIDTIDMPLQGIFPSEDTISLRESWLYEGSATAWHAGTSHSHLDGASFIYENAGIRWAIDPGSGNYNQTGYFDSAPDGRKWRIYYCRAEAHNTLVINPSELPDHVVGSYAPMTVKEVNDAGAIAVVDTTALHRDVSNSRRGFMFTDNRQSLVIRDEVSVTKESDVYWFMQTWADVSVDETGATLVSNGKTLRLDFEASNDATIEVGQSKPLPTSPIEPDDRYGDFNRIVIKMHGSGNMNLTVKLTPENIDATSVSDYDKSIDLWNIPH